jgi:hypothetical protein
VDKSIFGYFSKIGQTDVLNDFAKKNIFSSKIQTQATFVNFRGTCSINLL